MITIIANCSKDERNKYAGGQAGDQTGYEWCVRSWYNRPWNVVLRYPDLEVGKELAKMAREAAENDNCGYDQGTAGNGEDRYSFWKRLKEADYDPAKIDKPCEGDCSSTTAALIKALGYRMGIEKLTKLSIYAYTGDLRYRLVSLGWDELTSSKYLDSDDYLLPGDVLLYEGHHVCINLDEGKYANKKPTIYKGYKDSEQGGNWCAVMQKGLNSVIRAGLEVDGSCGGKTTEALKRFQGLAGLDPDGRCGPKTWATLENLLAQQKTYIKTIPGGFYHYEPKGDYEYIPELDLWVL